MNTIKLNNLTKATSVSFVVFAYLLIITALSLYILNTTTTHADTTSATASVTVPSACTLTSTITSGNAHSTTMVAGTFQEDIGTTNLKAICNDPDGLDIYAVGYSSNTLGNTNLVGDNGLNIATGLNTSSSTGNGSSNWAMKLFFPASTDPNANTVYQPNILSDTNGSYAEYHVIPATSTKVASFNAVTDTVVGSNLNTTYRIYLEQNQPAGTYIGQVKYTITHPNTSFSLYMQDFTPEMCNTLGTAAEKYLTVYDKRDNTPYRVGYLPDGRCWMLDNLALDLVNTPLAQLEGDTNATNTSLEYLKGIRTRNPSTDADGGYAVAGVLEWTDSNYASSHSMTDPLIASSGVCESADVCVNDPANGEWDKDSVVTHYGAGSGKIGIYYNYCAASAGSYCFGGNKGVGDAVNDVCPVGWRMPTGDPGTGEFWQLCTTTKGSDCEAGINVSTEMDATSPSSLQQQLSVALSGLFLDGVAYNDGEDYSFGRYWTPTFNSGSYMIHLYAGSSTVETQRTLNRFNGRSVRCILENRTISDIDYMQEISPSIARNTAIGTVATLKDSRDETSYKVSKLDDGRIWMLDNLAIDLTDSAVQANLTSITTNASDVSLGYLKGTSTRNPSTDPNGNYATAGVSSVWTSSAQNYFSVPMINLASKTVVPTGTPSGSLGNNRVGGYYNFCAASAGTYCYGNGTNYAGSPTSDPVSGSNIDAPEDICPRGWRLPASGADGEYRVLATAITGVNGILYNDDVAEFRRALSTPFSGRYYNGSVESQGGGGYFWSSTWVAAHLMNVLDMNSEFVGPFNASNKTIGLSVRCIVDK